MGGPGQEPTGQQRAPRGPQPLEVIPAPGAAAPAPNPANPTAPAPEKITFAAFKTGGKLDPKTYLQYPSNLEAAESTDYVRFLFKKYKAPFSSGATDTAIRGSQKGYNQSVTTLQPDDGLRPIALYMPEDIQAQYGAQWGGRSIQNLTANMLIGAGDVTDPGKFIQSLQGSLGSVAESTFYGAINEVVGQLQKTGQGEGLNTNDIFGSVGGIVLNPNTELLFQGFDLRTFTLSFKLVANEEKDTTTIRSIITTFKRAMLPKINEGVKAEDGAADKTGTQNFIGVPSLVDVTFMQGAAPNPWVTQFKPCAITSLNVNYTPDGSYSTYRDGAPVAITLQIGFSETKLVYREDIFNDRGIGSF